MAEDTALKNATARKAYLVGEIADLEHQLRERRADLLKVDRFIEAWHDFADLPLPELPSNVPGSSPERVTDRNPKKEDVAAAAVEIVREQGAPVPRGLLLEMLNARGIKITGQEPEKVLSTMLWRMPQSLVNLRRFGYWLPEIPYPPAGYKPGDPGQVADTKEGDIFG